MPHTLQARYVFPVGQPPIRDGFVTIERGRIVEVGPAGEAPTDARQLGNMALLPGLVNAHTHLELSDCPAPLGAPGTPMPEWIEQVMAYRARRGDDAAEAVAAGLAESHTAGTAAVGDIVPPEFARPPYDAPQLVGVRFVELIAPTADRVGPALEAARNYLDSAEADDRWRPGLSPHAPYTVRPELLDAAVALSAERRVPLAMHLAESPEEIELLTNGRGPLRQMLEQRGAWQPGLVRPDSRPIDYLRRLAGAHRALVVHGNLLDQAEIALLAEHAERMSVVYCPRTHARFGHPAYPLRRMLDAGVNVCLGTDSRASSPDLNLWAEMRLVAETLKREPSERHPVAVALEMATLAGARALGLEGELGRIAPGCRAALIAVALLDGAPEEADPHDLLPAVPGQIEWLS